LGLGYTLYPQEDAWGEWASMRATQIAKIFENVFAANDPITAGDRVHNVMATFTTNSKASEILLDGALWQEAEPGTSIDPATVFESLAIGAYFGGSTGARDSDLVSHWIDTLGSEQAMDLLLRHLKAGTDPGIDLIKFGADLIQPNGEVDPAKIVTGVPYDSALAIDLWDAIFFNNATVRSDVQNGAGVATGAELVFGADVHHYARVLTAPSGNTAVQLRVDPDHGAFESVLEFDGAVNKTLEQLIAEGTLFVRSVESLADSAEARFQPQKTVADQYGLDLIAYEGGQSFSAAIWGVFANNLNNQPLIDLLADLNDSPEMTELYDLWYAAWQSAGGGSLTHYSDYGLPGATGSWGQIDYLGQQHAAGASTPKYDFLEAFQNSASPWWQEMRDPGTFLQGRTNSGTAGDDTLVGTPEEDVIFGGEGNDWNIAGPGADALSGGLGINTVDGGDGDDLIILTSTVDVIDAGKGVDAVKFAHGLNALDLSALNATGVEVLDLRNDAHSTLRVTDQDLFDFTPARALTVYAETADTLELTGFDHQATTAVGAGAARHYQGTVAGETVGLTVITDIAAQPDVLLLP